MRLFSSPMRSPAILVFGAFVALALTAVNPAPPAPTHTIALDTPQRTYAVVIDYQRILNDSLFRATVTLRPVWTDMRPLWTRRLTDLYISATPQHGNRTIRTGQLISLQARRDGSYQGAGLVPRPRRLHRILFKNFMAFCMLSVSRRLQLMKGMMEAKTRRPRIRLRKIRRKIRRKKIRRKTTRRKTTGVAPSRRAAKSSIRGRASATAELKTRGPRAPCRLVPIRSRSRCNALQNCPPEHVVVHPPRLCAGDENDHAKGKSEKGEVHTYRGDSPLHPFPLPFVLVEPAPALAAQSSSSHHLAEEW